MPVSLIKRGLQSILKFNINDPRWGHRPGDERKAQDGRRPGGDDDGPPELAELWRDFNQRLNRLLGKRGDGPYRPDARGVGLSVAVVAIIAALIWLASGSFIVQDGQVGVVTTFGQFSRIANPGFNWSWPVPIEAHEIVDTGRTQSVEVGYRGNPRSRQANESLMPTADGNLVDVAFSVQYRIKDPVAWVFNNRDQGATVRAVAETALRQLVGASKLDTVLYDGRDRLAVDARRRIQQLVDQYRLGADIAGVTLRGVNPPEQVAAAFEDVVKAKEDASRERGEAQAFADQIIPKAKDAASLQLKDAETYRNNTVNTATGNAARFDQVVAEYAKAPGVMRDRMYLDTMQQILSSTSKVMIDAKTGTNQIYLPLDMMLSQSTANEAAIGRHSGIAPAPAAPAPQNAPATPPAPQGGQAAQPQAPSVQDVPQAQPPQSQAQAQDAPRVRDLRTREYSRARETR